MSARRPRKCLRLELETWPKPGLVSHVDCGSHHDMDAGAFRASAAALEPYFQMLAEAGARGVGLGRLRGIGIEAEVGYAGRDRGRQHASGRDLRPRTAVRGGRRAARRSCAGGLVAGRHRRATVGRLHPPCAGGAAQPR